MDRVQYQISIMYGINGHNYGLNRMFPEYLILALWQSLSMLFIY